MNTTYKDELISIPGYHITSQCSNSFFPYSKASQQYFKTLALLHTKFVSSRKTNPFQIESLTCSNLLFF